MQIETSKREQAYITNILRHLTIKFKGGSDIHNQIFNNIVSFFLFCLLIVSLQIENYILVAAWVLVAIFLYVKSGKAVKAFIVIQFLFGIGFFLYLFTNSYWVIQVESEEWHLLLRRVSLLLVLLPLFMFAAVSNVPLINYWRKPSWKEIIYFPFIWSGFHRTTVKVFLLIALSVNAAVFAPFIMLNGNLHMREIWLLALIFSTTNAVLEEVIWRGALLSRFSELLGDKWAVAVTSIGFGLQHYSLGFPWLSCLAFSIGGLFFGGITIKSNSIFPAMLWHFLLNMMMVLSGMLLN